MGYKLKRALVVGCAANLWSDVAAARELGSFDVVYCVKAAGVHWPAAFQVWVTLHPEYMDNYEDQRRRLGLPNGYQIVAPLKTELGTHGGAGRNIARRVSYRWPGMTGSASSGIYGAKVALDDGYDRVVLAGIPMTRGDHFERGQPWLQLGSFMPGFEIALPHLRGHVRSMSGYTAEVLGVPNVEWLNGQEG